MLSAYAPFKHMISILVRQASEPLLAFRAAIFHQTSERVKNCCQLTDAQKVRVYCRIKVRIKNAVSTGDLYLN